MLSGAYPTEDDGHGLVSIVWTTWSIVVSTTETVSLFVLATNNALPLTCIAVGCRPTAIDPTAADGFAVSMTLTSPVVDVPRYPLAGTAVPYESMVVSPGWARRPPSSLTYSLFPTNVSSRGAMPTFQVCSTTPVVGSSATTVFCPFIAAYNVDPSGEYVIWATRAERPLTFGIANDVGAPSVPSAFTGNRVILSCCGSQRKLPSGEYVGPSWPTVRSVYRSLIPEAVPTVQMSL